MSRAPASQSQTRFIPTVSVAIAAAGTNAAEAPKYNPTKFSRTMPESDPISLDTELA